MVKANCVGKLVTSAECRLLLDLRTKSPREGRSYTSRCQFARANVSDSQHVLQTFETLVDAERYLRPGELIAAPHFRDKASQGRPEGRATIVVTNRASVPTR